MNTRAILRRISLGACAVLLLAEPSAFAQLLQPTPPPVQAGPAALPPGLECTAEALNVSGFVDSAGGVTIYNVPSGQGSVRVRATCIDALGKTVSGQSPPVAPVPGGTAHFGAFDFGPAAPIAARLTMTPSFRLVGLGSSQQLTVGATFADLTTTGNVTASATGTTYRSSNPAVATVSAEGLVTAVGAGSALVYALHDGAGGLTSVSVVPAAVQSLSASPGAVSLVLNPIFRGPPAQLQVTAGLTSGASLDLTAASNGTTYTSSNLAVVAVSPGGAVVGVAPGSAVIKVTDSQSGLSIQVPVTVAKFAPAPFAAHDTPGFAYNVDIDGDLAFVADGPGGLQVFDVKAGAFVGALSFGGYPALDVKLRGKLAAVALGNGGVALVDVTDPSNPLTLSQAAPSGVTGDVWVSGKALYAASSDGLHVFDITDPAAPVELGAQAFTGAPTAASGDSARGVVVVLTNEPALVVLQAGGPLPWPAVSVPLPAATNQADDVVLSGTSAFVADGTAGIVEVDVTDPAHPFVKASTSIVFNALGVAVQRSAEGTIVAGADNNFVNAVPIFDERLSHTWNVDFSAFPGVVKSDANSTGIALGDGFGVVTVGDVGIQVFRTEQLVDNAGIAPTVSIVSPAEGSDVAAGSLVRVTAAAWDDVSVASADLFVDGQLQGTSVAPYSFFFQAGSPGATHTIQLQATDLGGNVGVSLPVDVHVVAAPPPSCDVAAGYSSTTNPNGAWSYGWQSKLGAAFQLFFKQGTYSPGVTTWTGFVGGNPATVYNGTVQDVHVSGTTTITPGQLALHPGPGGEYAVVQWTAGAAATYAIAATFTGISGYGGAPLTTTDVHVSLDGALIYSAGINLGQKSSNTAKYGNKLQLKAGQTVSFLVGYGNGNYFYDSTALAADVCAVGP